jgi:hypothetical protein
MIDPAKYENGSEEGVEPEAICTVCFGCVGCTLCSFCDGCPDEGLDADDLDALGVANRINIFNW